MDLAGDGRGGVFVAEHGALEFAAFDAALDDDLAVVFGGGLERGVEFFEVVGLRNANRRTQVGRLHEHREREIDADFAGFDFFAADDFDSSTTGRPRSRQTRFITSLSIETAEARTLAPT